MSVDERSVSHPIIVNEIHARMIGEGLSIQEEEKKKKKKSERNGSFFGTIFNFANAAMGAGMLSFPYTFYCTGVIAGIFISLLVIILTLITLNLLVDLNMNYKRKLQRIVDKSERSLKKDPLSVLSMKHRKVLEGEIPQGFPSYQDCIEFYLGTYWKRFCELVLLFYVTGILTVYFLVLGEFIKPCIDYLIPNPSEWYHNQRVIIIVFSCTIIFPLLMVRKMSRLWFTSFLAIVGALSLSIFTCINGIEAIVNKTMGPGQKELLWIQTSPSPGTHYPLIFLAIPLKCFGYQSHVLSFPICYAMKPGGKRWYSSVVLISITLVSCIYMTNGLFGWFAFGTDVKDNILNNFPGSSIAANLIRLACGVNIVFSIPVQNFASRLALKSIFFRHLKDGDRDLGTTTHVLISLAYFSLCLVCALFIPGLSVLFGFVGAIGAVTLMFFFPAVLVWKELRVVYGEKNLCWKIFYSLLSIFLFFVAVFFCVTGFIGSVFDFVAAVKRGDF